MADFERLGLFYLGRNYDLERQQPTDELTLYNARDLTTHAICVGMTGSGKTGLCITLLEEAAIDEIPAIVIDPKGDIANLLLTFPELRPEDFEPWVDEDEARRKGLTVQEYAAQQAALWQKGLSEWGQGPERIRRLRETAEFAIYTPASSAGIPVSILGSFAAPPAAVLEDDEALRERVTSTATSLLTLVGINGDPAVSREHLLIARILDYNWRAGQNLDLIGLIQQIQSPPFDRVGALELNAFYPAGERFTLAMKLNTLIASPGFEAWLTGVPLEIDQLLYTPTGKPRVAIFSIAHLSDTERMFFVSLLLEQVLGWMRAQPGTSSLRALLYIDELFGYLPPQSNPPSKRPLLTLLKQARAFGLGLVLATQNPVDLDYKAISNAGTWFIGRLQTERDKERLMDGLQAADGGGLPRDELERLLSKLGNRVFLLHNVHAGGPVVFTTRWAMSYLRGPLTRQQIKRLMDPYKAAQAGGAAAPHGVSRLSGAPGNAPAGQGYVAGGPGQPPAGQAGAPGYAPAGQGYAAGGPGYAPGYAPAGPAAAGSAVSGATDAGRPVLPPEVPQYHAPLRRRPPSDGPVEYRPYCVGAARVRLYDRKVGMDETQDVVLVAPLRDGVLPLSWDEAERPAFELEDLDDQPRVDGVYAPLPSAAASARSYTRWKNDLVSDLPRLHGVTLFWSPSLGMASTPGESERDFRLRVQTKAREQRDAKLDALRNRYGSRMLSLEDKLRQAQERYQREVQESRSEIFNTALSVGSSLLRAFTGSRSISQATTAGRSVTRAWQQKQDVTRAAESVEAVRAQIAELEAELQKEMRAVEQQFDAMAHEVEQITIRPAKTNVDVRLVALVWMPFGRDESGNAVPLW